METRDIHVLGRQAVALHQQGRPAEAEKLYRQVLAIDPGVFPALYLLGVLRLEQGDSADAAGLIETGACAQSQRSGGLDALWPGAAGPVAF